MSRPLGFAAAVGELNGSGWYEIVNDVNGGINSDFSNLKVAESSF